MPTPTPISDLIRQRCSCRTYTNEPMPDEQRRALAEIIATQPAGPFGTPCRFILAAASEERNPLRGLGTYGLIRGQPGFIIGTASPAPRSLEDFGWQMESLILQATRLGLGTCWLGGNFTRSSFWARIEGRQGEILPAVTAVGVAAEQESRRGRLVRNGAGASERLGWETLFFEGSFGVPLSAAAAGTYANSLEMVRLGPSASNKQPWRIVRAGQRWHFYVQRTRGYRKAWPARLLRVEDMQRLDLGIAMCHFALSAAEAGLHGAWELHEPQILKPDSLTEYTATWIEE